MMKRWFGFLFVMLVVVAQVAMARNADIAKQPENAAARTSVLTSMQKWLQLEQWSEIRTSPDGSVQETSFSAGKGLRFSGITGLPYPELFRSSVDGSVYAGADGSWFAMPSLSAVMALFEPAAMLARLERDLGAVSVLPVGADAHVKRYSYEQAGAGPDPGSVVRVELWVDQNTGLPVRMLSHSAEESGAGGEPTVSRYEYAPEVVGRRFEGVPEPGR